MSLSLMVFIISILLLIFIVYLCFRFPSKSKSARRPRVILIIALLATAVISGFLRFAPRGMNSLFGEAGIGESEGSDTRQTYSDGRDEEGEPQGFEIRVEGSVASVGDKSFEITDSGDDGLAGYIESRSLSGLSVRLVDAYALSKAYHYVEGLLDRQGAIIIRETGSE